MRKTGRYVVNSTSGESVKAFVPDNLPPSPSLRMDDEIMKLLSKANKNIEKLEIASRMIPSKEWLLYGFIRKEAIITSQIEGTQATLVDLFSSNEDQIEGEELEEVCNYIKALEYAWQEITGPQGLPLSVRLIKEAHKKLMKGTRGKNKNPGEFRTSQNWIGGTRPATAAFVPPPPKEMMECLDVLEKYFHRDHPYPLINVALIHGEFETIHPFLDGNGRVGRMLIALLLQFYGVLSSPLLYLSLFFKRHRQTYYQMLNDVRVNGNWEAWIKFFLDGISEISLDVVKASKIAANTYT